MPPFLGPPPESGGGGGPSYAPGPPYGGPPTDPNGPGGIHPERLKMMNNSNSN